MVVVGQVYFDFVGQVVDFDFGVYLQVYGQVFVFQGVVDVFVGFVVVVGDQGVLVVYCDGDQVQFEYY